MCSKLLQQLCAVKACVATIPAARNQPNSNALWLLCCWRNWAFWKMKQIEPGLIYIRKFFNKTLGSHTPRPGKPPCASFRKSVPFLVLILGVFWGMFQGSEVDIFLWFEALQLFGTWKSMARFFQSNPSNKAFQSHQKVGKVQKNSRRI